MSISFGDSHDLESLGSDNRHLKQDDTFNRTWWSVLSIDKLVTWQHLLIERTGGHVVLKASSCLRSLIADLSCSEKRVIEENTTRKLLQKSIFS